MPQNINGYLLVKDKDGQLKYYKDGKFFGVEEIQQKVGPAEETASSGPKKVTLKPILTFEDRQKTAEVKASESVPPIAPALARPEPESPVSPASLWPGRQDKSGSEVVDVSHPLDSASPIPVVQLSESSAEPEAPPEKEASVSRIKPIPAVQIPVNPAPFSRPPTPPRNIQAPIIPPTPTGSANDFDFETLESDDVGKNRRLQDQDLVSARTQEVLEKLKIQFTDEQIKSRFTNVLHTYFRGIRGKSEVEYILTLPRAAGGLELPKEKAEIIVSLLTHHSEVTNKERRDIVLKPKERIIPPQTEEKAEIKKPEVVPQMTPVAPPKQMIQPQIIRPTDVIHPGPQSRVGDVQIKNKLVGPIEELTYMTVEDFRRIGKNMEEIVSSLLEKVQLLSDESLARKIQGIKAWKQSPVFMLYLGMSMQGILQGKTIEQIIIDKQRNHEECLTLSEFEGISHLNSQLVY
jgi:hypothetical protein